MSHTLFGKWSEPGVPHKGWTCVDWYDEGEPSFTCEMCEAVRIRYVHVMTHPNYAGELSVGCVCGANMSDDYVGAHARDEQLKRKAKAAHRRSLLPPPRPVAVPSWVRPQLLPERPIVVPQRARAQMPPGWFLSEAGTAACTVIGEFEIEVFRSSRTLWQSNVRKRGNRLALQQCRSADIKQVVQGALDYVANKREQTK